MNLSLCDFLSRYFHSWIDRVYYQMANIFRKDRRANLTNKHEMCIHFCHWTIFLNYMRDIWCEIDSDTKLSMSLCSSPELIKWCVFMVIEISSEMLFLISTYQIQNVCYFYFDININVLLTSKCLHRIHSIHSNFRSRHK